MLRLRSLPLALLLAAGCNGDPLAMSPTPLPDMLHAPDLTPAPPNLLVTKSGIGDPCTGSGPGLSQGSCADAQICIPDQGGFFADGYCSAQCGGGKSCPSDARCLQVQPGLSVCLRTCKSDADCRAPDYQCTPQNKVCYPVQSGDGVTPGTKNGGPCVTPTIEPGDTTNHLFGKDPQLSPAGANRLAAETELAVDPLNKKVVVAWIDIPSGGSSIGIAASATDGASFATPYFLPTDKLVDKNKEQSDPVVTVDPQGNFYVIWIGFDRSGSSVTKMNLYVARSTNGGVTFGDLFLVAPPSEWHQGGFIDKPWIAASPVDGTLYATWSRAISNAAPTEIRLARSTDKGQTWSDATTISDGKFGPMLDRNLAQVTVGGDGRAAVAWVEIGSEQFGATSNVIVAQRLEASGKVAAGGNVRVSAGQDSPAFDDPSVAVDGSRMYVGFISGTKKGAWDVRVAASMDGGVTFGPSVKANDDATCATHFHHQIAVDAKGAVHAIWYDNRYLKGNVFHAASPAAGVGAPLAFGVNTFVNNVSFPFTTSRSASNWLGDYLGLATAGSEIYACWSDPRTTNRTQVYFSKGILP